MPGSDTYCLYYYWRSLLASQTAGALGRDFYTDICIYRAHNAQHKHHLPCSTQTATSTQLHTHQGLCTWPWSNTAHSATNAQKAYSGPTCLHRQDREINLCQYPTTPMSHRWSFQRKETFTGNPKLGAKESQPTPALSLLASLPEGETQKGTKGDCWTGCTLTPAFRACTSMAPFSHSLFKSHYQESQILDRDTLA